jgi:sulfur-oxidizing protein SoxA
MTGVRAEPFGWGSPESAASQPYPMRRAAGMMLETPAVRP